MTHVDPKAWPVLLSEPISDSDRAVAEQHAADCPECRAAQGRAQKLLAAVSELSVAAPSAAVLARVKAPILAEFRAELGGAGSGWWRWMLAVLALAPIVGAAALASSSAFELGHGLRCSGIELLAGALPVAALALRVRARGIAAPAHDFALAAGFGSLAGQGVLVATCPSHALGHLVVFHALVVGVAMLMGAAVGRLPLARAR